MHIRPSKRLTSSQSASQSRTTKSSYTSSSKLRSIWIIAAAICVTLGVFIYYLIPMTLSTQNGDNDAVKFVMRGMPSNDHIHLQSSASSISNPTPDGNPQVKHARRNTPGGATRQTSASTSKSSVTSPAADLPPSRSLRRSSGLGITYLMAYARQGNLSAVRKLLALGSEVCA